MNPDMGKQQLVQEALARYEKPLLHYVRKLLGDLDRSRDVVQDAFLQLWKQDPEKVKKNVSSWLYTVCRNRAFDRLRRENTVQLMENGSGEFYQPHPDPLPSAVLEKCETEAIVFQLIKDLPTKQREVLLLKFQSELSYKQISEATGYSVSNVGFIIHTAVKEIRAKLKRTGLAPGSTS